MINHQFLIIIFTMVLIPFNHRRVQFISEFHSFQQDNRNLSQDTQAF